MKVCSGVLAFGQASMARTSPASTYHAGRHEVLLLDLGGVGIDLLLSQPAPGGKGFVIVDVLIW